MKRKMTLLGGALILGMGLEKSSASIVLTIDDSNPAAVTFTATGLNADANFSTSGGDRNGVQLLDFFNGSATMLTGVTSPNSGLYGPGVTVPYNTLWYRPEGGNVYDLKLEVGGSSSQSQIFSTSQPAFSGSWTINFTALGLDPSALPAAGTSGNILGGDYTDIPGPATIGQWQVEAVPEPGTGSLLLLGSGIGLIFWRHRSGKNVKAGS